MSTEKNGTDEGLLDVPPGHWLVYGITGGGKTSWLKERAWEIQENSPETPIIIYDPFFDEGWPDRAQVHRDKVKFHERVWSTRDAVVIHDEAGDGLKNDRHLDRLAIQARHLGHTCYFSAQRPQQISTTVRGQCPNLIFFHLVPKDGIFLAEEFGDPVCLEASNLPPLHYYYLDRWGKHVKGEIVFQTDSEENN